LLLACALGVVVFKSSGSGRQRQNRPEPTASNAPQAGARGEVVRLSAPTKPAPGAGSKSGNLGGFDDASLANVQLQTRLEWNFGGKRQRGWGLYTPLISHLIGAGADATPTEFAMRLSQWQKSNNLDPTGLLDAETWSQMVSKFQSRRVKGDWLSPDPNRLVTIPVADCYDPTRAEELRSVERDTFRAYKRMVAAAAADSSLGLWVSRDGQLAANEKFLKIISAYRSRKHQEQLRQQSPHSGRAGLAINSPHFSGRAIDLYVGGEPVSTKDENRALQTQTPIYRWLVKNASRFGFQPYFYEPWHWEYIGFTSDAAK
jgi:hypothetical protein